MHLFFVLFSFQFNKTPTSFRKFFKQCINVWFVNRVSGPMLRFSKLTYFKYKTIIAVFHVIDGFPKISKNNALIKMQYSMLYSRICLIRHHKGIKQK